MNQTRCAVPLFFRHRPEHVVGIYKVQKRERAWNFVDLLQEVLIRETICVLIEEAAPHRACARSVESPRLDQASLDQIARGRRRSGRWGCGFGNMGFRFDE